MRNEIYCEGYCSYVIRILKSGTCYTGQVLYGDKVYYECSTGWIGSATWICTQYLLRHLKWWIRHRGNKRRQRK